ncbi:hypothetical protein HPGCJGGD_4364 [Methylobacterium haplocladii]|nr:hypothetical protein HPGCJGGD_4364 [Methylobacterium haplocladii]
MALWLGRANDAVDAVSCSIDAPDEPTDANTKPGG